MSLAKKYEKSKTEKWLLRFKTRHPRGDNFDGVVTHVQRPFVVLADYDDFVFDGTVVLPKKVIKGFRDGAFEVCANAILHHSGHIRQAKPVRWLDGCATLKEVLEKIRKKDIWPAVEIMFEVDGKTETDYFIGKIIRLEDEAFWIYDYDATGKWQQEWEIHYDEIFKIQFGDSYTRCFNAYMGERLPDAFT